MCYTIIISSLRRSDVLIIFKFFPVERSFSSCIGRYCSLFSATAPPGREPHYSPISPPQAPQQPLTILQQLPVTMMPPGSAASIRPGGHVKDGKADCHQTQTKSHGFTLSAVLACLSHYFLASTQLYYLCSSLEHGQLHKMYVHESVC